MLLKDKVAVITGGAGLNGLGYATARLMAAHGARVVRARPRARRPGRRGGEARRRPSRPGRRRHRQGFVRRRRSSGADGEFGRIDILVNNAGITQPRKTLDITRRRLRRRARRQPARHAVHVAGGVPDHARSRSGSIINISSVSAQRGGGILGGPHYSAAKAGVLGLARAMAREFGLDDIRVNCDHPRPDRDRHQQGQADPGRRRMQGIAATDPAGPPRRAGRRRRLPASSSRATCPAYCTGVTLDVNGGMLIH